jgi:hypothetical protein
VRAERYSVHLRREIGDPCAVMPSLCAQALVFTELVSSALFLSAGLVRQRADGSFLFEGKRPDQGHWHGHGYFHRFLWVLRGRTFVHVKLWKHRWRKVGTSSTCHSRTDEETPSCGACTIIVLLLLWAWLDSGLGLAHKDRSEIIAGLEDACGSRRTQQRALHRFLLHALDIQQAFRRAVVERCEPRPVETVFEGGLSPPKDLMRRRWKDPSAVEVLWRALVILLRGALVLDIPAAHLLAEARGRWNDHDSQCPF